MLRLLSILRLFLRSKIFSYNYPERGLRPPFLYHELSDESQEIGNVLAIQSYLCNLMAVFYL